MAETRSQPIQQGDGQRAPFNHEIGRHVVIAAGAVVAGIEVPDYSVVAGVPARVIRRYVDGTWKSV